MKQQRAIVIFDWDGTLVDSIGLISQTLSSAARHCNVELSLQEARQVIGLGLPQAAACLFPNATADFCEGFIAEYKRQFVACATEPVPFAGAQALLDELQEAGFALAVATGKSRQGLTRALQATGWHDYFFATRCADETQSKPHPLMVHQILQQLGLDQDQARPVFLVGDTSHDIHLAHNAGVTSIAVTTGAHSLDVLERAQPHFICDSLQEAVAYIHKLSLK